MSDAVDTAPYRAALAQFATGVVIVTAPAEGAPVGMTMNSFSSVSLDPPLILFSIDRRAYSLEAFQRAEAFAVNVLSQDQHDLCMRFAMPLTDKWKDIGIRAGHGGAPLIDGALAHFECEPWAVYDGGDHLIFVCRVVRFSRGDDGSALVCFNGQFHELTQEGEEVSSGAANPAGEGKRGRS